MDNPRPVPCPTSFVVKKGSKIFFWVSHHADARVSDDNNTGICGVVCFDAGDGTAALQGLYGIIQEIEKHLVQFTYLT